MSEYKFEKLSFWQLLENRSVEIPIIQRDYAQGRAKKQKVRNDFLEALKNALTGNPVELDFVYGKEENNVFQPLDGQQRLTTLFLLHWFIANKEGKSDEAKKRLLKFTYETRTSSREFCNELIDKSIDYINLLPIDEKTGVTAENQLSKTIQNASWFVISWENDPTISAMLIMLDAIQAKLKDSLDLWQKLTETEEDKRPITFLYIKLENFGLSDDLYIKMNTRGKELTSFENFKSRFEKHIEKNEWEKDLKIQETDTEEVKKENLAKQFKYKVDGVWTDLFWEYRQKIERIDDEGGTTIEYKIDDRLTNFIAGLAINYYAQGLEIQSNKDDEDKVRKELEDKNKNISDNAIKRERIERRMVILFNNPNEIAPNDFSTKKAFEYLVKCFDKYSQDDYSELKTNVDLWKYCDETLFKDIIQNEKLEWQNRVVFYAQTAYLLNSEFDINTFNDWMRVIRNIVENSTIDSATTFISAVNLIHELSAGCLNIYGFLSENMVKAGHAQSQIKEEIEKAKIIVENPDSKQVIHDIEDTNFCKGRIDFALYCIDYDIESSDSATFDKVKLEKTLSVITSNFEDVNAKLSDDFKRAFLTIRENKYYEVWESWSYSFDCHKRWLLETVNDLRVFSKSKDWKRDYLKDLFVQLVDKVSFQQIIANYKIPSDMPEWKQRLIEKDNLIEGATFILIPNDESYCKLAWQQKPSREDQVKKII